ncbi:hypothetical protein AB0I77_45470 [Streptomyces sp. NPDC050619]|uniref:hypothetical protein n=1 Tax=Streptomyces sp. NPDC050619 TaxID=3157214 RepID=UPI00342B2ED1
MSRRRSAQVRGEEAEVIEKAGRAEAGQLRQQLDKAGELGLADTSLTALNGRARS